jgi:hypothetical protein
VLHDGLSRCDDWKDKVSLRAIKGADVSRNLLTAESKAELIALFTQRHGRHLRDERIVLNATLKDKTVVVMLSLNRYDKTCDYVMEAAKGVPDNGHMTLDETRELCFDFIDWYLVQYFENDRELLLPLDWQPHRFGEIELMARGDIKNAVLDEAADAWLRGERPEVPSRSPMRKSKAS